MNFLNDLNKVQQDAVQAIDGPVMIVAGAGSGKTRVLTYRVAFLVHKGIPPAEVLALTFTNKAAKEMKSRIVQLVGPASHGLWMGTFHSIFARMLRAEAGTIGFDRNFTIYDSEDSLGLIKAVMNARDIPAKQFNPNAIRAKISSAKNSLIQPAELAAKATDIFEEKTAVVFNDYEKKLREFNAMDFDDLIIRPIEIFEKYSNILEKYQYRFRYILIDEYQDTNRAQYRLVNLLAGKHKNICIVGDDAQSIYAFRGADIRNILDFEKDYTNCRIFRLEQNYRSTKTILAAADAVIKNNKHQIKKTLWTENQDGELITLLDCADEKDEGTKVVHYLEEDGQKYKISFNEIAILYRTNAQSRTIEDSLRHAGIPYVIVGGIEFYKRKEIKDVLAYLKAIVNSRDEESILRIINYPSRGISEATIKKIRESVGKSKLDLFTVLQRVQDIGELSDKAKSSVMRFAAMMKKYIDMCKDMTASELARSVVDELGILHEFKQEGTPESLARWENVQELLSAITEFCADKPTAGLAEFLEEVSLIADIDRWDENRNAVTLMTLHAAKGLEFPVVFIVGLEEGLLPMSSIISDQKEVEEERRLFYVGITRAMKKLYLAFSHKRYRYGAISYQARSRFVDEVNETLLECDSKPSRGHHEDESFENNTPRKSSRKSHKEEEFTSVHPDYETESQEVRQLYVGTKVFHESFGFGKVVAVSGRGENARASVSFQGVGVKQLLLKYANLKIQ